MNHRRVTVTLLSAVLSVSAAAQQPTPQPQPPQAQVPSVPAATRQPFATTMVRPVEPRISSLGVNSFLVTDVHLRPLYVTTIRLPEAVSSIAVGAPTMFAAEHAEEDPRIVYVKPTTHDPADSNLLIALVTGETISMRLVSPGDAGSDEQVDFVLDLREFRSQLDPLEDADKPVVRTTDGKGSAAFVSRPVLTGSRKSLLKTAVEPVKTPVEAALSEQVAVAAPLWLTRDDLKELHKANDKAPLELAVALGPIVQNGEYMLASYSLLNIGARYVEIMPPQIQISSPQRKPKKKGVLAEQVPVSEFRMTRTKLPPGARIDGVVQFARPGHKQSQETLLLQLATAAAVDTPMLLPLPVVAPSR